MRKALIVYTRLDQISTNGTHALKLIRPRTEPSIRIGVIAANTSWKYTSVDCGNVTFETSGMFPWPISDELSSTGPGWPHMLARNPLSAPKICIGEPKPILNPHNTQATSTTANATNAIIIEFTDQRFCITPP